MGTDQKTPGSLMAAEISEATSVFAAAVDADHSQIVENLGLDELKAIYTIARGSSDAVANTLSYEFMRHLKIPVTSLPPSAFSVFDGVAMNGGAGLVISQSGASNDLVRSAEGVRGNGGTVLAITNKPGSDVQANAQATIPIGAGPELAVPATKSVIGSIAAGMALLGAISATYKANLKPAKQAMQALEGKSLPEANALRSALLRARHVFVIGRGAGFGAAQEVALKIKETCALHAEPYSASEVLHGPLQLATNPLLVLMLDTGDELVQDSLDQAERRLNDAGGNVWRIRCSDAGVDPVCPAAACATLLYLLYPVILSTALALGHDPDRPETLAKETLTT